VRLVASDDLDEHRIAELVAAGAPYDAFGVGTAITLTPDAPSLGAIYKLVEIDDRRGVRVPVGKRSPGKASFGGSKQVFRRYEAGRAVEDLVARSDEDLSSVGSPLLVPVLRRGKLVRDRSDPRAATREARERCQRALQALSEACLGLEPEARERYPVTMTEALRRLDATDG
jgi:nicotinate phosphoribosyltransferase